MRPRTSALAFFSFFSGLFALAAVLTAWFLCYLLALIGEAGWFKEMLLAARIVAVCTVAPALVSIAFWLAARGVVRESQGMLLGKGLYRTGVVVSVLSVIFAVGGRPSVLHRIDQVETDARRAPEEILKEATPVVPAPPNPPAPPGAEGQRPWIGIEVRNATEEQRIAFGSEGVAVWNVVKDGPADGHISPGHYITAVAGIEVMDVEGFERALQGWPPGAKIRLAYLKPGDRAVRRTDPIQLQGAAK